MQSKSKSRILSPSHTRPPYHSCSRSSTPDRYTCSRVQKMGRSVLSGQAKAKAKATAVMVLALALSQSSAQSAQSTLPNLIFLMSDQHRDDAFTGGRFPVRMCRLPSLPTPLAHFSLSLISYHHTVPPCSTQTLSTPNFDRLFEEGVRFDTHYTSVPSCTPARAGILTGRTPWRHGQVGEGSRCRISSTPLAFLHVPRHSTSHRPPLSVTVGQSILVECTSHVVKSHHKRMGVLHCR